MDAKRFEDEGVPTFRSNHRTPLLRPHMPGLPGELIDGHVPGQAHADHGNPRSSARASTSNPEGAHSSSSATARLAGFVGCRGADAIRCLNSQVNVA